MFRVRLRNARQQLDHDHARGPLEFGRGPRREAERVVVEDLAVSRDQLTISELAGGRLRVENLSKRVTARLRDGATLAPRSTVELPLPLELTIGATTLEFLATEASTYVPDELATISAPVRRASEVETLRRLIGRDETPDAETLARWFETVVRVQQAAATSEEFYAQTARAVVELVGLDEGFVLLFEEDGNWSPAARHEAPGNAGRGEGFSQGILDFVRSERRTFFRDLGQLPATASLSNVAAAVASPIFGSDRETVVGAVYGSRWLGSQDGLDPIRPLEAQLVQVLAAAVGAGLRRIEKEAEATRRRVQFESFFTPRLVAELDRNPDMLADDERDVTILFADIRGFTDCTARLGPRDACELVRSVMDHMSGHVQRHDGVIVDYYGDGLMAMWNAPVTQAMHADLAIRTALDIHADLSAVGSEWQRRLERPLEVGIGLNTGPAVVGNVGSTHKFKYGALGLTVNLAQRIESVTKQLGHPVLCSAETLAAARRSVESVRIGPCLMNGATQPVELVALATSSAEATATQPHERHADGWIDLRTR